MEGAEGVCPAVLSGCYREVPVGYSGLHEFDGPLYRPFSSSTSNLYVATGFNKWGMTSSMVSAMLLSDLVGKTNPFAEVFSPSRTVLRPSTGRQWI